MIKIPMVHLKNILILLFALTSMRSFSQVPVNAKKLEPDTAFENIFVKKLASHPEATSMVIWVKKAVKMHKHASHTESLYVLSGKGIINIGDAKVEIKRNDYFTIPKNTYHALKVTSRKPIKVLSIQAPEFFGKDRVFKNR